MGREEYYTRELATDHEQYLSGHGESPGRWYGAGAAALGLQGEASPAGFQAMFEGRHPDTGELLGRPHGRNAVPGFDVVLRPTKSVSVLYGLGDPAIGQAVLAAHHAGVWEAVAYLDGHLGVRRGHGGHEHVSGHGLLAVGFDHRTSREGDPLLHTHLVVANRVQGPDGRWTALDGRDLYRHRLAADAIYRATYQRQLSSTLGVGWTAADRHGNREFQGVPDRIVAALDRAPVAIGTRAGDASGPVARRAASRVFNLAIRGALGLPFGDTQSGLKGFQRAAAQEIFSQARVDGFAFDVEVLWLARQLGLEVTEVSVQALERQGSKVQMVADALAMLGEVWDVRRTRTNPVGGEVGPALPPSPEAALTAGDPPLAAVASPTGAPPALQTS
jgi:conjugative relaxase-like TrwC/TraI family protein